MIELLALVLEDPTRGPRAFWQALVIPVLMLGVIWLGMKVFRKSNMKKGGDVFPSSPPVSPDDPPAGPHDEEKPEGKP